MKLKQIPLPKGTNTIGQIRKVVGENLLRRDDTAHQESTGPVDAAQISPAQLKAPAHASYFIERTRAGNLPIYTDYNNAGGVWTEVRKIRGNAATLRNDLKVLLGVAKKDIWVQPTSQHVVIKGNHASELRTLLENHF